MAVKVKELKEDAVVSIEVNKAYYLMMKGVLYYLFQQIEDHSKREASLQKVMKGKLEDMDSWELCFHTITMFIAEVEAQARKNNLYEEKDILEPGDEGYVEPTIPK